MNYPEVVTKRVLETILCGAVLDYRAVQSNGEYDFDLRFSDGTVAALEVTASVNQVQAATVAAIRSKKKGGSVIPAIKCQQSWVLFPVTGASINQIRQHADEYLSQLEQENVARFFWPQNGPQSVRNICCNLGIRGGGVIASATGRTIRIALPGGGGAVGASVAVEAAEREASKEDNRKKLGASTTAARHLVVYVDPMNGLPWVALTTFPPPATLPKIPAEITDLWLIGHTDAADQFIAWHGRRDQPWQSMTVVCR